MAILTSNDWLSKTDVHGEAVARLILLDMDIASTQIAIQDYQEANSHLQEASSAQDTQEDLARAFHHAKTFVCSVRRAARLLEALSGARAVFPEPVADAIRTAWRKKKAALDQYTEPRNAIEHIDGEIAGKTVWIVCNLAGDSLCVTENCSAQVSEDVVDRLMDARNEIIDAVIHHMPRQ